MQGIWVLARVQPNARRGGGKYKSRRVGEAKLDTPPQPCKICMNIPHTSIYITLICACASLVTVCMSNKSSLSKNMLWVFLLFSTSTSMQSLWQTEKQWDLGSRHFIFTLNSVGMENSFISLWRLNKLNKLNYPSPYKVNNAIK